MLRVTIMLENIIKLLIADFVVDYIQVLILIEEVLMPPPLGDVQIPWLRSIDVLGLEPQISQVLLLKHELWTQLQRGHTPIHIEWLHRVVVRRLHVQRVT